MADSRLTAGQKPSHDAQPAAIFWPPIAAPASPQTEILFGLAILDPGIVAPPTQWQGIWPSRWKPVADAAEPSPPLPRVMAIGSGLAWGQDPRMVPGHRAVGRGQTCPMGVFVSRYGVYRLAESQIHVKRLIAKRVDQDTATDLSR